MLDARAAGMVDANREGEFAWPGPRRDIEAILAEQKPEAVYFTADKGQRTAFVFLKLNDSAEIPKVAEPWFLAFNARVECHPVVLPEDIERAGPAIEQAVARFG